MRIQVFFGSRSDERVYTALADGLGALGLDVRLDVISAHREPEELSNRTKASDADVFVCGAGLAAHLPGAVASRTLKPVFGVPVSSQLGGLDAFLSILQMPAGIPVLAVAPDAAANVVGFLRMFVRSGRLARVRIVLPVDARERPEIRKELDHVSGLGKRSGIAVAVGTICEPGAWNLVGVPIDRHAEGRVSTDDVLVIRVPLLEPAEIQHPETAVRLLRAATEGVWVGISNFRNAFLAALRWMNNGAWNEFLASQARG
ncbi:MAG: AIR carboxylase family protein [Pseudomonadota bacterium]